MSLFSVKMTNWKSKLLHAIQFIVYFFFTLIPSTGKATRLKRNSYKSPNLRDISVILYTKRVSRMALPSRFGTGFAKTRQLILLERAIH